MLIECLSKNIIKFEFENLLFIYMCLINSSIFVVSTAELFLGKYISIWKVFIYWEIFINTELSLLTFN